MSVHLPTGLVPLVRIPLARQEKNFVQFDESCIIDITVKACRKLWKLKAVLPSACFIKDFAQRINISLRTSRPYIWNETFGSHVRVGLIHSRHQANIGQLCHTIHEDD